ncbi:MAG TPA: queuosine precursor transporter [Polyangiaceae bacterium]|jgi:hypothetical protein
MHLDARSKLFIILSSIFSISLVVGDIIGGKLIQTAPWGQPVTLTVGMIPFPITFLLTDVINEFYGKRAARFVTIVGFSMALLAYLFIGISASIPIAPMTRDPGWKGVTEDAFNNVFMSSRRMIAASLTAYLVSQFTDIAVFHALKERTGKRVLWLRASGSTAVSQLIDTVVINLLAWWGVMSGKTILNIMLSSYGVKFLIAIGLTPVIYAVHAVLQRFLNLDPVTLGPNGEVLGGTPKTLPSPQGLE